MHLLNKPGRNNDNFETRRNLFILSFACDFSGAIEIGCNFDLAYIRYGRVRKIDISNGKGRGSEMF